MLSTIACNREIIVKYARLFTRVIVVSILSGSFVYADKVDGESLLNSIRSNDHENVQTIDKYFYGYINGVADAAESVAWCSPDDFKSRQLQKIVTNYYKESDVDTAAVSTSANELILKALADHTHVINR